jgi:hypothetical protein
LPVGESQPWCNNGIGAWQPDEELVVVELDKR